MNAFGTIAFCLLLGTVGAIVALKPRLIPRATNAYYKLIHMKSRLADDDYEKTGVRVAGGLLFVFAVYVLIERWARLWN